MVFILSVQRWRNKWCQIFHFSVKTNCTSKELEPQSELVDQAYPKFNETLIGKQDSHNQIKNYEATGVENSNENESADTETNKTSAVPNFISKLLTDN